MAHLEQNLLYCVRNALRQALATEDAGLKQSLTGAAEAVVNELLLRQDTTPALLHYANAKKLCEAGINLLCELKTDNSEIDEAFAKLNPGLDLQTASSVIESETEKAVALLRKIVECLPSRGKDTLEQWFKDVTNWEVAAYQRSLDTAPDPEQEAYRDTNFSAESFEQYLNKKFPEWGEIRVSNLTQLAGGFSNKTLAAEINDKTHGAREIVIRAQQNLEIMELYINRVEDEFPVIQLAYEQGIRVAKPLWAERDSAHFGNTFLVSEKAPGRNLGTATGVTEEITEPMLRGIVEQLLKIHQIDLARHANALEGTALERWQSATVTESIEKDIAYWRSVVERYTRNLSPLFERGLRWLEDNIPQCEEKPVLVHADAGLHNVLIEGDEVSAVLDWEACHIGDPANDLAWLLACTDTYSSADQLLKFYTDAGGTVPSEYRMRYQDVFACIRVPIASIAAIHLLNKRLDNIQLPYFGLLFPYHNTSRLIECIEAAEAAKGK